ncbi:MAG: right-handed parallel beta-helix repeat-containing protein [Actinomycetota bacterium]|nr:right-handed parallel beta-helix repeat-containing protein [Actinomycetota bacterium]
MDPGQHLNEATRARPAGTTFWLSPGVHTLGTSEFGQVIPKDDNAYIGAPGAILDGKNVNRYAFTQTAVRVTIRHLTITNFVSPPNEGVVNGSSSSGWRIERNTITGNKGAGVFMGSDTIISHNCLDSNGQYGLSGFRPRIEGASAITNVVIDRNEISRNNTDDWETRVPGCGCSGGAKFWDVSGALVTNNYVHHNRSVGLWADTNNIGFMFEGNYISENDAEGIWYEISYNAVIRNNTLKRNTLAKGREFAARRDSFPVGSIYIAESGGDERVNQGLYSTLEITGNHLEDNWGGVVLWEAADRFCNSPANTSSSYCTRVNPSVTLDTCVPGKIRAEPYYSDCRWKTQNVSVHGNLFRLNKAAIGCANDFCGRQGLLSNYGTYPEWSPYKGWVIAEAVTFQRNNVFRNNTYVGDWRFTPHDPSRKMKLASWQAPPYNQDSGSRSTDDLP